MRFSTDRLAKLQKALEAIDAAIITDPYNRRYLLGFDTSDGTLVVKADKVTFITDSRYIEFARASVPAEVKVVEANLACDSVRAVRRALGNAATIALEFEKMSVSSFKAMETRYTKCMFVAIDDTLDTLRTVKDESEIERMKAAQQLTDDVFYEMLKVIHLGQSEKQIAAEIASRLLTNGADWFSFTPIVAAGANGSKPHAVPGDTVVKTGDFVTMDFGCLLDGYCSDMTRTVAVGGCDKEKERVYETVLRAQTAGIRAAKAGVLGSVVHQAALDIIASAGFGHFFKHGFGHGLGLEIHENPRASLSYVKPLPEGTVISAEPGIYIPGKFGVRIEDVIIIRENNAENITESPKELIILD
ncbi:MAG: Xaa-Pro peptidase family protein [Oscillospiraceae bacterium]|nr:Xaa-Pro peptidase family protein [Oscillospiraceae bacterium]